MADEPIDHLDFDPEVKVVEARDQVLFLSLGTDASLYLDSQVCAHGLLPIIAELAGVLARKIMEYGGEAGCEDDCRPMHIRQEGRT